MKKYECLYIVNINFDSEGISTVVARVEEILKNVGAEVKNTQHWGKRKLAYAIDKERYGNYVLLHFEGEDPDIAEFHREVEIEASILHYLTVRLDEFPDFDTLSVPQAVDAERKRFGSTPGRRPGRYDDDRDDRDDRPHRSHSDDDDIDDDDDDVVVLPDLPKVAPVAKTPVAEVTEADEDEDGDEEKTSPADDAE